MRVAHIITRMIIGGAQENTLHTVVDQHELHGDEVCLITGPETGPEGSLLDRVPESEFPVYFAHFMRRRIGLWQEWRAYRELCQVLHDIQPDIVHTHSSKAGILGRAAAASCRIPAVHTIHGAAFHFGQNPVAYHTYVQAEKWAARRTAHFISVADDMTREYLQAGIGTSDRYTTISSGFDVEPFLIPPRPRDEVRAELGLAPSDIVVGKVARLFHLKGHEFILQAAPKVIAANPDIKFLFVGDGILREQYERQIADAGLSSHFRFTGLVPPTQIPELMGAMDIVAHTSQWEGLARVLPQGLIAGKPVVSFDVGGAREVVLPGETGYLLPRDDVGGLTAALIELAANPELRTRLGATGRKRFTDQFRHQTMTRRIREIYEQVLRKSGTG